MNDLTALLNAVGTPMQTFSTMDGATLYYFEAAGEKGFRILSDGIQKEGYALLAKNALGGVTMEQYRKGDTTLHLTYAAKDGVVRLIAKENAVDLQATGMDGEAVCTPLVTQISLTYYIPDCGMSYLIRLKDGRFVIIDGGYDEYETVVHLWETLEKQNVRDGKPVIAAWFISHCHEDHFSVATHFINDYKDKAVIQNILYNWAQQLPGVGWFIHFCEALDKVKDETRIVTPRSGERYSFGGLTFDALFVGEDLYPTEIKSLNNTSLILRIEAEDKILLFPGDSEQLSSDFVCSRYDKEALKCDLLQVAHHGYYGGSEALYKAADPEVLFWPCPDYWFPVVKEWGANPMLRANPHVKAIFISGRMQKTFDLAKPFDYDDDPFVAYKKGETVYHEDFPEGRRVAELGWECLTGGRTGYGAASTAIMDGKCILKSHTDRFDVISLVRKGVLDKNPDYTFTVQGEVMGEYERIGLFYDYAMPTVFSEEKVLWLDLPTDRPFDLTLKTDKENGKALLTLCGEQKELPFAEVGGLLLLLKSANIALKELTVVRN